MAGNPRIKVDFDELMPAIDYIEYQNPKSVEEALLMVRLSIADLANTAALTLKDWSENQAVKIETKADHYENLLGKVRHGMSAKDAAGIAALPYSKADR